MYPDRKVMPEDHVNYAATWGSLCVATGVLAAWALRGRSVGVAVGRLGWSVGSRSGMSRRSGRRGGGSGEGGGGGGGDGGGGKGGGGGGAL